MNEKDDKITHLGILSNLENGRKLARFSNSPGTTSKGSVKNGDQHTWGPRIGRNASKGFESNGTAAEQER